MSLIASLQSFHCLSAHSDLPVRTRKSAAPAEGGGTVTVQTSPTGGVVDGKDVAASAAADDDEAPASATASAVGAAASAAVSSPFTFSCTCKQSVQALALPPSDTYSTSTTSHLTASGRLSCVR